MLFKSFFFFYVFSLYSCLKKSVFLGNWKVYPPVSFSFCKLPIDKIDRIYYVFLNYDETNCHFADEYIDLQAPGLSNFEDCSSSIQKKSDLLKGNFYQLQQIKQKYPNKEILAVVGGNIQSEIMSHMMRDMNLRQKFVKSCVDLVKKYDNIFDGIDLDYEYPCLATDNYCGYVKTRSANDKSDYYELVKEFRNQLGPSKILTIDVSAIPQKIDVLDLVRIDPLVDSYNIMSYDFTNGNISPYTGHHTQLYSNEKDPDEYRKKNSCFDAATYFESRGASPSKINIGVAFYGKGFLLSNTPIGNVPFVSSNGTMKGKGFDEEIIDYSIIMNLYSFNNILYDNLAQASYIINYDKGYFLTFDDPKSVNKKAEMANGKGYQGLFAYELTGDYPKFELLSAMNFNNNKNVDQNEILGTEKLVYFFLYGFILTIFLI